MFPRFYISLLDDDALSYKHAVPHTVQHMSDMFLTFTVTFMGAQNTVEAHSTVKCAYIDSHTLHIRINTQTHLAACDLYSMGVNHQSQLGSPVQPSSLSPYINCCDNCSTMHYVGPERKGVCVCIKRGHRQQKKPCFVLYNNRPGTYLL